MNKKRTPYPCHSRCNQPAVWLSEKNGYRACSEHVKDGMLYWPAESPDRLGPCDCPIEYRPRPASEFTGQLMRHELQG